MSSSAPDLDSIVRVSVVHAERRTDVAIPGRLPLIEVLPGIARSLGVLDPTLLHGGYKLTRANGNELDPTRGAFAQDIDQGEILTLARGGLISVSRRYDDVVEAVIDATSSHHAAWKPEDAAHTATAISLTLLGLSAILLALQPAGSIVPASIAGVSAFVLLAVAATLSRISQHSAGIAFGLAAAAFGALCGYLLVPASPDQSFWGYPLACAAVGAIVVGGLSMLVTTKPLELLLLPVALGVALGIPAGIVGVTEITPAGPYAIAIAASGMLAGALPWLTLSSTRIKVVSPLSDIEMFDPPPPIDEAKVTARVNGGHRLLIALRVAFALAVLIGTPVVASESWLGTVLAALTGATFMFQSRQSTRRASVLVLVAGGTAIIAISGLTAVLSHPAEAPILLVVLLVATGVVTGLTLLSDKVRLRLTTLGDTVEVILLALLLPLSVVVAGIV
ncbi:type VII secretion integral membrane protein EccD [Leucobacter coleopterorum]|uniref:Type VII secretion integral membrane protein EccD n=1 Tax=Leucobacter coleopterorum TaxID=2714933 RepID=A0ABX6JYF2_9MICO|nr:type VII secretion integral membrane protein EccD [Leucobacter coleopterorum]QIM19348.1 type VII secretion integral membrane protein EccD [Leucobacter coleopterorum]